MTNGICFLRRKRLGANSIRGMRAYLNTSPVNSTGTVLSIGSWASVIRNDKIAEQRGYLSESRRLLIRWGCTTATGVVPLERQLNTSSSITKVNNKMMFRQELQENDSTLVPKTITETALGSLQTTLVLRPATHAQGRNLFVVNSLDELLNVVHQRPRVFCNGWYASELIDKVAEYRVYVVSGKVATVAKKTPVDPSAIAWNVAEGGRFDVVRWGDWPLEVCRVALEAFKYSGLDFSGVDVMVGRDGRAYVLELNSAPSLPLLSDGSVSYRQKVMAKCFKYISDNGKEHFDTPEGYDNWRQVIHPAIHTGG